MIVRVYYDPDGDQVLKVNGEIRQFNTAADLRNLLLEAYTAGFNREGFVADNQFNHA